MHMSNTRHRAYSHLHLTKKQKLLLSISKARPDSLWLTSKEERWTKNVNSIIRKGLVAKSARPNEFLITCEPAADPGNCIYHCITRLVSNRV